MIKITSEIKALLIDIPIEKVAEELGIKVTRHHALCFMHDDHHPSLVFYPSSNRWKCFVCNVWGDNISLVMKYNIQNFIEACVWLSKTFDINIEGADTVDCQIRQRVAVERKVEEKVIPDLEVLEYIISSNNLTSIGRHFLVDERGYSEDVIKKLRICSIENEKEFTHSLLRKFGEARLKKCQLVYKRGYKYLSYFHAPCLFFPYFDKDGNLLSLQARYLGDENKHQRFQFPKGTSTHIFNLPVISELKPNEPLFISEGVTDTIALLSSGYKAVAIPSATLLKTKELEILTSHPLLMYPDNDEPGEKLFNQIQEAVNKSGGSVTRLMLPNNSKDFSDFYQQ